MPVNQSINQTVSTVANLTSTTTHETGSLFLDFLLSLWNRFVELISAPSHDLNMLWMAIPLFATLFVMQLYFGRYIKEELGWNTAVGNSMVLIFIALDLFRYIGTHYTPAHPIVYLYQYKKTLVASLVLVQGFALWNANFFHKWPKKIAFFISNPICVNVVAYIALASVYSNVPFDGMTLLAGIILFLFLLGFFWLVHKIQYVPGQDWKPRERKIEEAKE